MKGILVKNLHLILRTEEPLKGLRHRKQMVRSVFGSRNPVEQCITEMEKTWANPGFQILMIGPPLGFHPPPPPPAHDVPEKTAYMVNKGKYTVTS